MSLSDYSFDQMLPSYLTNTAKGRIKEALEQFFDDKEYISYNGFYTKEKHEYLMQSDVVHSVVGIDWNAEEKKYITGFVPALLISNSCDVALENDRSLNSKEALFAPIISVDTHLNFAKDNGSTVEQVDNIYRTLRRQEYTNLFYLPPNPVNGKDYIVRLDKIYWVPQTELIEILSDLDKNRFISLSDWGYYLYITKLSLHTCRIPEEIERKTNYG
jgi:hypothetical protein